MDSFNEENSDNGLTKAELMHLEEILEGNMPDRKTLAELIKKAPDELTRALQAKALIDIATVQDEIDFAESKEEVTKLNAKLTHIRWCAERLLPKMFGSKQQIEVIDTQKIDETQIDEILQLAMDKAMGMHSGIQAPVIDIAPTGAVIPTTTQAKH